MMRRFAIFGLVCSLALTVASAASFQTALIYLGSRYHILFIDGGILIQPSPAPVRGGLQRSEEHTS